jgi:plasmid stability protein
MKLRILAPAAREDSTETHIYGKLGTMKTTLELPDDLMRRVKLRAVHRNRRLKDEIARLLEAGMASAPAPEASARAPKPVRLRGRKPVTFAEIEAAIAAGRE